jgi:LmbE family N-acetylglucosaminyl deacetylase
MLTEFRRWLGFHPRALLHSMLTYPRFMGRIKPEFLGAAEEEVLVRLRSLHRCWEPSHLECPVGRRLLVLAPHPDDEAIGVGGLLLAHRGRSAVHVVNLFNGEAGGQLPDRPWKDDPDYRAELVAERRKEMAAAGERLGVAALHQLDLRDGQSVPNPEDARKLRAIVDRVRPDVVLLPWFLDNHRDHRVTNILYSWSCRDLNCPVLGFEVCTLCQPNSVFDITPWLNEKLDLVGLYQTQVTTIDYLSYVRGLAQTAFLQARRPDRGGAMEAMFALPSRDYCDLVIDFYGSPGTRNPAVQMLI